MTPKWHLRVIVAGAIFWCVLSRWVTPRLPAEVPWYQYPFALPIYVARQFGAGGDDLNLRAGNIAWIIESLLFGVLADAAVAKVVRYRKGMRS
jgi:hypothetical protein